MSEAYLDNASTTRVSSPVAEAMADVAARAWGNPSSEHARGDMAREVLEQSRAVVAGALGVDPEEVFFTSGATESNNLAIRGACQAAARENGAGQIVVGSLEHPSVTRSVRGLKREGWEVAYLDAPQGDVDLAQLEGHLARKTTLVTNMLVQNELGYLMPVREIVRTRDRLSPQTLVHTDAAQAFGKVEVLPRELGVDLLSVASHKIGGPAGVGALYVKRGTPMFTTAFGGGQERGLRSGTEPVFLIAGFARAVELAMQGRGERLQRTAALRDRLIAGLRGITPDARIHSRGDGSPYIVNFAVPGLNASRAVRLLGERGVMVSRSSACSSNHTSVPAGTWREKHPQVLELAGYPKSEQACTLRVSFGFETGDEDVDRFVTELSRLME